MRSSHRITAGTFPLPGKLRVVTRLSSHREWLHSGNLGTDADRRLLAAFGRFNHGRSSTRCCLSRAREASFADFAERPRYEVSIGLFLFTGVSLRDWELPTARNLLGAQPNAAKMTAATPGRHWFAQALP